MRNEAAAQYAHFARRAMMLQNIPGAFELKPLIDFVHKMQTRHLSLGILVRLHAEGDETGKSFLIGWVGTLQSEAFDL